MAEEEEEYKCSNWLIIATTIFLLWTVIFTGVRAWAKLRKSLPWVLYDYFFTSAFVLAIAQCASTYSAVHYGFGKPSRDIPDQDDVRMQKALYASQILYLLSIGSSKVSVTMLLSTLTRDTLQKRICFAFTTLVTCWSIASVFTIALRGSLSSPWQTTYGHSGLFTRWLVIETLGLTLELLLWLTSIYLTWTLNMPTSKRLQVITIFGLRLLLIPLVTLRLKSLHPAENFTTTLDTDVLAEIFTQAVMQYSLIAECMTCMKPFLHPFHSSLGWSSADAGVNARYGMGSVGSESRKREGVWSQQSRDSTRDSNRDSGGKVPAVSTSSRRVTSPKRHRSEEEFRFRADNVSYSSNARGDPKGRKSRAEDDIELLRALSAGGSRNQIHQTRTVHVTSDDSETGRPQGL